MRIDIRGAIVPDSEQWIYDWFEIPAVSPKKIMEQLDRAAAANVKNLVININSPGGSVYAASEIYAHIKKYPFNTIAEITGVCASAATMIAHATNKTVIAPGAAYMIHNASATAEGDYREMESMKRLLIQTNEAIMQIYMTKTKKSKEELQKMMDNETWMNAQQAVEHGFVDEIMFSDNTSSVVASVGMKLNSGLLPREVIEKMRNELANDPNSLIKNNASRGVLESRVKKEEKKIMNLEQLKNEYPDLVKQIQNEAAAEAIAAERKRIQEIENIAVPGAEEIINKAKFETGVTAGEVAVEILKNDALKKSMMLQNIKEDAQPINEVEANALPQSKDEEVDALINKVLGDYRNQKMKKWMY